MKARIKNGKIVTGKAAEVFMRIGIAEEMVEMKPIRAKESKIKIQTKELKTTLATKELKVKHVTKLKPAARKRGRPKVKK